MDRYKLQAKWPPVRRETALDVQRDIALANQERAGLQDLLANRKDTIVLYGSEDSARSMKAQLRRDLDEAFTDDDRAKVVEHWIQKLMRGGRTRAVAERAVLKMLKELVEDE